MADRKQGAGLIGYRYPGEPLEQLGAAPAPAAKPKPFGALIALVGATAAAALVPTVQKWEGREHVAYRDVVGIWTICDGDTKNVRAGQVASDAECDERLERQLIAHAKPVLECVPQLKGKPYALAASASLAYNVGPTAFCKSTIARRFRAGDVAGACNGFLAWDKAGGRVFQGLVNRRRDERKLCLKDAA